MSISNTATAKGVSILFLTKTLDIFIATQRILLT